MKLWDGLYSTRSIGTTVMVTLDETTIAMTFAVLGVVFSIVWLILGLYGINTLRDIRNRLKDRDS